MVRYCWCARRLYNGWCLSALVEGVNSLPVMFLPGPGLLVAGQKAVGPVFIWPTA